MAYSPYVSALCFQAAILSLAASIEQRDWDAATRYCMHALSVDEEVLHSRFAGSVVVSKGRYTSSVLSSKSRYRFRPDSSLSYSSYDKQPTADYPDPPAITLSSLRKRLLDIFTRAFRTATQDKNEMEASRFFKLFPLVGWKAEGLEVYR